MQFLFYFKKKNMSMKSLDCQILIQRSRMYGMHDKFVNAENPCPIVLSEQILMILTRKIWCTLFGSIYKRNLGQQNLMYLPKKLDQIHQLLLTQMSLINKTRWNIFYQINTRFIFGTILLTRLSRSFFFSKNDNMDTTFFELVSDKGHMIKIDVSQQLFIVDFVCL